MVSCKQLRTKSLYQLRPGVQLLSTRDRLTSFLVGFFTIN